MSVDSTRLFLQNLWGYSWQMPFHITSTIILLSSTILKLQVETQYGILDESTERVWKDLMCLIKAFKILVNLQKAVNPSKYYYNLLSSACVSSFINHDSKICGLNVARNFSKYVVWEPWPEGSRSRCHGLCTCTYCSYASSMLITCYYLHLELVAEVTGWGCCLVHQYHHL